MPGRITCDTSPSAMKDICDTDPEVDVTEILALSLVYNGILWHYRLVL